MNSFARNAMLVGLLLFTLFVLSTIIATLIYASEQEPSSLRTFVIVANSIFVLCYCVALGSLLYVSPLFIRYARMHVQYSDLVDMDIHPAAM